MCGVTGATLQGGYTRVKSIKVQNISADSREQKGRQFFRGKIGVTASIAAPGDTNPSDATDCEIPKCDDFLKKKASFCWSRPTRLSAYVAGWRLQKS